MVKSYVSEGFKIADSVLNFEKLTKKFLWTSSLIVVPYLHPKMKVLLILVKKLKARYWTFPLVRYFTSQRTQASLGRLQDVCKRPQRLTTKPDVFTASGRRRRIYNVLKRSNLHRLEDVQFITSWRRLFYDVLKTSDLRRLEDAGFTSSWRRPIYIVLKTSDLRLRKDVWFTTSWWPM